MMTIQWISSMNQYLGRYWQWQHAFGNKSCRGRVCRDQESIWASSHRSKVHLPALLQCALYLLDHLNSGEHYVEITKPIMIITWNRSRHFETRYQPWLTSIWLGASQTYQTLIKITLGNSKVLQVITSPHPPDTGISIKCLELYHVAKLHTPHPSIHSWVKTLCDIHLVSCINMINCWKWLRILH